MCSILVSVFGNKLKDPGMQIKVGINFGYPKPTFWCFDDFRNSSCFVTK